MQNQKLDPRLILLQTKLMKKISSICVYCGSRPGIDLSFKNAAIDLGKSLAKADFELIYGGGDKGIMGYVAAGARAMGGKVISIIPKFLINREASIENLQKQENVIITQTMHQRKQLMFDKADVFIALPGGIGTLEELTEILTWAQLARHNKPIILANINNFWQPLLELFNHMVENNFITNFNDFAPIIANDVNEIMQRLDAIVK